MFSHRKIVYQDFGTQKIFLNTTGTTEKYLIVSSVSEWMGVLLYEQPMLSTESCPIGVCVTLSGKFPYSPYNYLTTEAGSEQTLRCKHSRT